MNHKNGDTVEDAITITNLAPSLEAYIVFSSVKMLLLGRGAQ